MPVYTPEPFGRLEENASIKNACFENFPPLEEVERRYLKLVLEKIDCKVDGKRGALETLQMNRFTLYNKMKKYGLRNPG